MWEGGGEKAMPPSIRTRDSIDLVCYVHPNPQVYSFLAIKLFNNYGQSLTDSSDC